MMGRGVGGRGGHGRETINNSLVYTGGAATLRNKGHPWRGRGGGKKIEKERKRAAA